MISLFTHYTDASKLQEKGSIFAEFHAYDLEIIKLGLESRIHKNNRAIRDLNNNPNNEGQVTYTEKIRERERENRYIGDNIEKINNFLKLITPK